MRSVRGLVAAIAVLPCGCRGDGAPAPAVSPSSGVAHAAPASERGGPPGLDCDKLLGVARAQVALGRAVLADPGAGAGRCRYRGGPADPAALVDVVVACREAAAPIARAVFARTAAGFKSAGVGQKSVVVDEPGQGLVQFLEQGSPCAAEVTAVPADRAVAVAREVARGLAEGGRP